MPEASGLINIEEVNVYFTGDQKGKKTIIATIKSKTGANLFGAAQMQWCEPFINWNGSSRFSHVISVTLLDVMVEGKESETAFSKIFFFRKWRLGVWLLLLLHNKLYINILKRYIFFCIMNFVVAKKLCFLKEVVNS